ncbi:hypothetical protein GCM10022248_28880 [Nonomuraea soli]
MVAATPTIGVVFRDRSPVEGAYNPVVADGVRWLDYERAAAGEQEGRQGAQAQEREPLDWFDRADRPPRLSGCRPYGMPGGLARPDPQAERDLARALPPGTRFADPRSTWVRLINAEGPAGDPFRAGNAADCALAVVSTWHGEPAVAAPRQPEYDRVGRPLLTGETGAASRMQTWLGQPLVSEGPGRQACASISGRLLEAGHGACAVLVGRWSTGGSHAWNAVNHHGEVIWIDAQRGLPAVEPCYPSAAELFCAVLDRRGRAG